MNKWWESSVPHTFVIGEMAGTHGVKRPGGSALNSGQIGGLRAAECIAYTRPLEPATLPENSESTAQIESLIGKLSGWSQNHHALSGQQVLKEIQRRMTAHAAHIREMSAARSALAEALQLYRRIESEGLRLDRPKDLITAIRAEHLALTSVAYLKAIVELLASGSGSRGSHLVLAEDGQTIHPAILRDGKPLRFKPENSTLRTTIQQIEFAPSLLDLFETRTIPVRPMPKDRKAFEPAWQDFREGRIYTV